MAAAVLLTLNVQCSEAASESAILCTALNIYHEARGESVRGQLAVAMVTRNRAKQDPDKACEVVFKRAQFSWTLTMNGLQDSRDFEKSIHIASLAWESVDFTNGSTHYHADHIRPEWSRKMVQTTKIGRHIFYRSK